MATTYTANALLQKPATADRGWDVPVNANTDQLDAINAIGSLIVTPHELPSASLNVRVTAGSFRKSDGTLVTYAGISTFAVSASATTCLWLTDAGALASGVSFPATGTFHVRLATVVAGGTTITTITDARVSLSSSGANLNTVYLAVAGGTLADGANVILGSTTGTQIGTATTQKLGLWGATPVVQPSGASQAAVGALATQSLTVSTGGSSITTFPAAVNTAALTDSTGGTPGTTLALASNTTALTDSTGGTPSSTLAAISDVPTANAVASLAAQLAIQLTLNGGLVNDVASLAAQMAIQRSLNSNLINAVTSLGNQVVNVLADLTSLKTLNNAHRTALVAVGLEKGGA